MVRARVPREFLRLGVPIGLSTLFEVTSFTFMAVLIARLGAVPVAGHQIVLTPAPAIAAATINAAFAIRREATVGSLEQGKQADVLVLDAPGHRHLGYRFGTNLVRQVVKNGHVVFTSQAYDRAA